MIIETLEAVWSGALECAGVAPGLSSYRGRSSLYHSPAWERWEGLAYGEVQRHPGRPRVVRPVVTRPTAYRKHPALTVERAAAVLALLQRGVSYSKTAAAAGVTRDQARAVGKRAGIVRGRL